MDDGVHDLVPRLFALLTARLEDGAAIAADGQTPRSRQVEQAALAKRLRSAADDIAILADAVLALIEKQEPDA